MYDKKYKLSPRTIYGEGELIYDDIVIYTDNIDKKLLLALLRDINETLQDIAPGTNQSLKNNTVGIKTKDTFIIMCILIYKHIGDIEWIKKHVKKYIENDLLSKFSDLTEREKKDLRNKEHGVSLGLWDNNNNEQDKINVMEEFNGFDLNSGELQNVLLLKGFDEIYLNGIISDKINIKELMCKRKKNEATKD
jgi:hypothetical protein